MFYSQFILAKKGPLGTIWIAAHLERKLRKNQVADTDIGVSVDSILFPEVPIALRLSSHLLLGVVRIYSRKVNYLFDDCSEALLKIKQAFRSTAVDLPPEESTAPYHSITLPETFDLDDFELPDNEIFQGNYVDHHVSTKEQITLQDTMEGVVYSTSQFGLDERFGDGDTSQIGLDLDEELLLSNVAAPGHGGVSDVDTRLSVQSEAPLTKDGSYEGMIKASEAIHVNGSGIKVDGQAMDTRFFEYAQAPSTPGLLGEPDLASIQEALASDEHMESDHNLTEVVMGESAVNACRKSDLHPGKSTGDWSSHNDLNRDSVGGNGCIEGNLDIKQVKPQAPLSSTVDCTEQSKRIRLVPECSDGVIGALDGPDRAEDIHNGVVIDDEPCTPFVRQTDVECLESTGVRLDETVASPSCSHVTSDFDDPGRKVFTSGKSALEQKGYVEDDQASPKPEILNDVDITNDVGRSCPNSKASVSNSVCPSESPERPEVVNFETQVCREPRESENLNSVTHEVTPSNQLHVLRACNSHISQPDMPSLRGAEIQSDSTVLEQLDNTVSNNSQLGNINISGTSDFPAPEVMLSVPEGLTGKPSDLLVGSTPDVEHLAEVDEAGATIKLTGKKRSFPESTLTVQSLNSVESFGVTQSKRTTESIPDDDDLLSSILVGRRSSVLKMKPTPPAPEVSMKRTRSVTRPSVLKRKVLMDDSMVLHGDTIRQQLTNTEDIRRVRKKAPCTRPEISTILRQFLEDEIFNEPILTGMSAELIHLHSETFDLSGTRVSENELGNVSSQVTKDMESSVSVAEESEINRSTETGVVRSGVETQLDGVSTDNQRQQVKNFNLGSDDIGSQDQVRMTSEADQLKDSQHEPLGGVTEMEVERGHVDVADTVNSPAVNGLDSSSPTVLVPGDIYNVSTDSAVWPAAADKIDDASASMQKDESCISPDKKFDSQTVGRDASLMDISNGKSLDDIEILEHGAGIRTTVELDSLNPADGVKTSLASECSNLIFENGGRPLEETGNDKLGVANDDDILPVDLVCNEKGPTSSFMSSEATNIDSTHSVEHGLDVNNAFMNGKGDADYQGADLQSIVDGEIPLWNDSSVEGHKGFEDITVANDTEFLNVDDDEGAEVDDETMPNTEESHLLENSGWSSRTRAVAKYLQILFDKEAAHGRKVLPMDNLLAGKTRKEASRMFFETLVLKTRDYIHVEQGKPFDNVNIKPRAKLMKSDF